MVMPFFSPQWIAAFSTAGGVVAGALGYVMRQWARTNELEKTVRELEKANLHTRLTALEQVVTDIRAAVAKLAVLDTISVKQELLITELRDVKNQLVPRGESQARWESIQSRFDDFDTRIVELERK